MKIDLNGESRSKLRAVRKALNAGVSLAGLFAAGCGGQEVPVAEPGNPAPASQCEAPAVMGSMVSVPENVSDPEAAPAAKDNAGGEDTDGRRIMGSMAGLPDVLKK